MRPSAAVGLRRDRRIYEQARRAAGALCHPARAGPTPRRARARAAGRIMNENGSPAPAWFAGMGTLRRVPLRPRCARRRAWKRPSTTSRSRWDDRYLTDRRGRRGIDWRAPGSPFEAAGPSSGRRSPGRGRLPHPSSTPARQSVGAEYRAALMLSNETYAVPRVRPDLSALVVTGGALGLHLDHVAAGRRVLAAVLHGTSTTSTWGLWRRSGTSAASCSTARRPAARAAIRRAVAKLVAARRRRGAARALARRVCRRALLL